MQFKAEGQCPKCHTKGKVIALKKMINHVDDLSFIKDRFDYFVCKKSSCENVYFNISNEFTVDQLNKEVGYKQSSSEDANICYCYNIKKSELNEFIFELIEEKMEFFPSSCGIRNPYGKCCLVEIKKVLKENLKNKI